MLTFLGISMVIVFTYLIMTKKLSPINALTIVPIVFAIIGGFGSKLGEMMLEGLKVVAPSAALLLFAILFFGILIDAGLFDPLIKKMLQIVKGDPVKIAIGTAILASTVALDGDGTTTHMITISAMLPLYLRLGMNPLILAIISLLSLSIMSGMTPWGGPATRAIASLGLDANEFFIPLLPTMLGGLLTVIGVAYALGRKERQRLGVIDIEYKKNHAGELPELAAAYEVAQTESLKRPKLIWINLLLTIVVMVVLIMGVMPVPVLFLIGFVLASMINYPNIEQQKERLLAHSGNALTVVTLVFAAGIFTGIFSGTKMVDAIANSLVAIIPDSLGSFFPVVVALTSMPFTFVLSNDAYYFGVLPILAEAGAAYGVDPVEIARASILGQPVHFLSPLVASTLLLVGMVKTDIGELQRYGFKWAIICSLSITIIAILTGAITVL
ncbi:damage-inducible protein CinA [Priestia aryabhattai]|uniref:CitMHS family transporter n=1 Tax=Bacillaceae TaxID=186817 RepID=UPI000BA05F4A|nr:MULTISPECIES: citrate:proton symporter [Bacillaceae]MDT2047860.1 citrate:proton symporter [Priestia flexa]OZT11829.1 damage-inducible protein CinA [Priestia aryabhattai]TDB52334.1 damage-inducible protein CinA [Bacillus sp. CBEL-1]USY57094.1 citrate:proton symporter [Bacillus sp. 1780r2a1]